MGSEARAPVRFHLTGFKKFHNVADNPTEVLMGKAKEFVHSGAPLPGGAAVGGCTVLETAGAGALDLLLDLLAGASEGEEDAEVVWVHLGVNSGASRFAVEQRAINEATFRCPDEMGWQPDGMPIVDEDGAVSAVRETQFPAAKIVAALAEQGFDTVLSYDAGRFVCNYVYYHSLRHAAAHGARSLFVHVPPFAVINGFTQLEFIAALLRILASLSQ